MARVRLERRVGGGVIAVTLESADVRGHSLLTGIDHGSAQSINIALVNVLDVAQKELARERSCLVNPVGGACGDDSQRNGD